MVSMVWRHLGLVRRGKPGRFSGQQVTPAPFLPLTGLIRSHACAAAHVSNCADGVKDETRYQSRRVVAVPVQTQIR